MLRLALPQEPWSLWSHGEEEVREDKEEEEEVMWLWRCKFIRWGKETWKRGDEC
jgi:hypothetical protein